MPRFTAELSVMATSKMPSAATTEMPPIGSGAVMLPEGSTPVARPMEFTADTTCLIAS